jgi:hypothetical protein
MWDKMQDDHYNCWTAERDAAEKKKQEEEDKLRGIEKEKPVMISNLEGAILFTQPDKLVKRLVPEDLTVQVSAGDTITSDPNSHVELSIEDGFIMDVGPETMVLYIDGEFYTAPQPGKHRYDLLKGRVRFKTDPKKSKVTVKTPGGTASDRNTDFIAEVDPDTNMTSFYVQEGAIDVNTTKGEAFVLNSGQMITIDADGKAEVSGLVPDDWYNMVNSLDTGEKYVKSAAKEAENNLYFDIPQDQAKVIYAIMMMSILLIALMMAIIKRRKNKMKVKT